MSDLTLKPIGIIRAAKPLKFHARHQPDESSEEHNVLELYPEAGYRDALVDLEGFSRVWLIWWFHRNEGWKPMVIPPRGPKKKRGVFATRSPHRPNALGMTPVKLLRVEGNRLILGPCDLVDGTPVFDIKPYIPAYDAFPEENAGWVGEVDTLLAQPAEYTLELSALATSQCDWLAEKHGIEFRPQLKELLERDPTPHRTRRIRRRKDGVLEITCGAWRIDFEISDRIVRALRVTPMFKEDKLHDLSLTRIPERAAQLEFLKHRAIPVA